jgi:hypothetical protein
VLHLHHERGYSDPQTVATNKAMRQRTESHKIVRTDYGISQLDDAQENTEK